MFAFRSIHKRKQQMNYSCCNCWKEGKDCTSCKCGEEWHRFEWTWQKSPTFNYVLSNDERDVLFHPVVSSGTATVRGNRPFRQNMHYYWEVKVLSKLYGTDVMIGLSTNHFEPECFKLEYCSILGSNDQSWGYSYVGRIQHRNQVRSYGRCYSLGSLIGVYVDMFRGTVEYYYNRKSLGLAFGGLKPFVTYPTLSSTSAKSKLRLTCSVSHEANLQIECLKVIRNNLHLTRELWNISNLATMLHNKYFWLVPPPTYNAPLSWKKDRFTMLENDKDENFVNLYLDDHEEENSAQRLHAHQGNTIYLEDFLDENTYYSDNSDLDD